MIISDKNLIENGEIKEACEFACLFKQLKGEDKIKINGIMIGMILSRDTETEENNEN